MTHTLVIAECGSSWRFGDDHLSNAYRLIDAVKECGADVAKFQWASNGNRVANRRNLGMDAAQMYSKYLEWPREWMEKLKAHCDKVGLEWMCTVYVPEDIPVIAPLVKRLKVSAFECEWNSFVYANCETGKEVIVSVNPDQDPTGFHGDSPVRFLHCISKYPAPLEDLKLWTYMGERAGYGNDGLSDHTGDVLTGAVAVGAGAQIIEAHVKLQETPKDNPDYPHSLPALSPDGLYDKFIKGRGRYSTFAQYVYNIRQAERML